MTSNLIYDGKFYDLVNESYQDDIKFYLNMLKNKETIELCCGTGRLTIPLTKYNIKVTGIDNSKSMIAEALKKTRELNLEIKFYLGDIRTFSIQKKFDAVILAFNSLQNFLNLDEIESVLENVKTYMRKDSLFIFDIYNPDFELLMRRSKFMELVHCNKKQKLRIYEKCYYDKEKQINFAKWHIEHGSKKEEASLDTRCFFPQEIDCILKYNGFKIINKFGDFEKNKFSSDSKKQIFVCKLENQ